MINSPKLFTQGIALTLMGAVACTAPQVGQTSLVSQSDAETAQTGSACTLVDDGFGPQGTVQVRVEEVVTGLEVPWGIAFLPKDEMLVTERPGRIRLVQKGQLRPQPIATVNVSDRGEGGLLGIATHPDFAQNRFFYIYFTASAEAGSVNRVERWRLSEDGVQATRDRIIVDNIPVARFHNGGRIRFGPDGMLYIGTGDARDPDLSQDVNSLAGKILRVTPEGQIPADNPFSNNPVYISGIRNTQGFDWMNPSTLWVSDHGPSGELGRSGHDEVSIAQAGDNLGWPTVYRCDAKLGLVPPTLTWRQALPPGGAAVYTGQAIPEWKGSFMVAALGAKQLQRIVIDPQSGQLQQHEIYLQGQQGRLREAVMGPDGDLYVTTSNCDGRGWCPAERDKILRITR
ncbi:PQQ-dependent sugar dehydrogenase [Acaryochloris sp. IP29b_bin.148]|uniref:PQQ-dependent sugar dehydrogenase n=1 Tax=Acaryochloris sp. IP29b_bin.148 TaxID=2969218 RepID=UPI00260E6A4F|nr:PQQ-dependent sugar dehydrogenase [Acaryochloris sp. IP29b_bin.148]